MRMTFNTRLTLVAAHGIAMLIMGLALLYIRTTMTNFVFDVFGSIFALLLVAASFLLAAILDWICAAGIGLRHFMELRRYLLVSVILAIGSLFFFVAPDASIQLLCYFTAAYALFLGIGKLRLALHWECSRRRKIVISLLGAVAICFSGLLVAAARTDARDAVAVLAAYAMFVGGQMLLSVSFLYQQTTPAGEGVQRQRHIQA